MNALAGPVDVFQKNSFKIHTLNNFNKMSFLYDFSQMI